MGKWDWRNVGGKNYVGEVINQGSCGSCYSIAVGEMISSRMRVLKKDETAAKVSPDPVLKCSFYAQGCQGGFPFLASKYAQDFGTVLESTRPYTDHDDQCQPISNEQIVSRNVGYKYVGGYYGACGEKSLMRELFDHGPFVVGFEVGLGFHSY